MAWGSVMAGKQRCPSRRVGTISPLQSACDFWEPVRAPTAALAPPGSGFLEVTPRDRRGCAWGQAAADLPPGRGRPGLGWWLLP